MILKTCHVGQHSPRHETWLSGDCCSSTGVVFVQSLGEVASGSYVEARQLTNRNKQMHTCCVVNDGIARMVNGWVLNDDGFFCFIAKTSEQLCDLW